MLWEKVVVRSLLELWIIMSAESIFLPHAIITSPLLNLRKHYASLITSQMKGPISVQTCAPQYINAKVFRAWAGDEHPSIVL